MIFEKVIQTTISLGIVWGWIIRTMLNGGELMGMFERTNFVGYSFKTWDSLSTIRWSNVAIKDPKNLWTIFPLRPLFTGYFPLLRLIARWESKQAMFVKELAMRIKQRTASQLNNRFHSWTWKDMEGMSSTIKGSGDIWQRNHLTILARNVTIKQKPYDYTFVHVSYTAPTDRGHGFL